MLRHRSATIHYVTGSFVGTPTNTAVALQFLKISIRQTVQRAIGASFAFGSCSSPTAFCGMNLMKMIRRFYIHCNALALTTCHVCLCIIASPIPAEYSFARFAVAKTSENDLAHRDDHFNRIHRNTKA